MRTRTRIALGIGAAVAALALTLMFFLRTTPVPDDCPPPLDLGKVRAMAAALPGEKPREVRVEHVLSIAFPGAIARAGGPWRSTKLEIFSYQVVLADKTLVVDAGMSLDQAKGPTQDYDAAAEQRMRAALDQAAAVYITHEHVDHIGGLLVDGHALYKHAYLTPQQMDAPERFAPAVLTAAARAAITPLLYEDMVAVAPGVVLIKAPGHTPGSQWVYIHRADGAELLLLGDTAWHMGNIEFEQGPPPLVTLMLKNDRHANACQLAALHALQKSEPRLEQMPGHDGDRLRQLLAQGVLISDFI